LVLLEDIPIEVSKLNNEKRTLEAQQITIQNAQRKGISRSSGAPERCSDIRIRFRDSDCIAFESIKNLPTAEQVSQRLFQIEIELSDILNQQLEIVTDLPLTEQIILGEEPTVLVQQQQQPDNAVRNALLIGGALLLIL